MTTTYGTSGNDTNDTGYGNDIYGLDGDDTITAPEQRIFMVD